MLYAVIMAGGSGTRFWPESRNPRPKQLLQLVGERTMLQSTVDRLGQTIPADRVLILTNRTLVDQVAEQLPELPRESILGEPCKRDTAPCIGLAAWQIVRQDPDAIMVVMPSDHVISPDDVFQQSLQCAAALVEASPERIVTFGIRPTYPAESFGYIERGAELELPAVCGKQTDGKTTGGASAARAFRVQKFREKPKADVAREYLASGNFYWNAGIFAWRARTILDALARYQPEMYAQLAKIDAAWGTKDYAVVLDREFAAIRGVSIDYAVMEHATDVVVIEAPFAWDDVGSWQAITRLQGTDVDGNTIAGKHLGLRTSGTLVRSSGEHLIVTLGVSDCIIVHTPDATLVANKHDEESIRQLVKLLQERGWQEYL